MATTLGFYATTMGENLVAYNTLLNTVKDVGSWPIASIGKSDRKYGRYLVREEIGLVTEVFPVGVEKNE